MTAREQLAQFAAGSKALPKLCREYKKESATVHLKELVGGALSFYAAAAVAKTGGVLQNQNYRCRWKAGQLICDHL